ncbi:FAD-binding oxidoreductase [Parvularcula lutaonensis]|nr:FAD-binding oxidoreductase [Parvularcula lutaonensis]GGY56608.1 hypothetical protein GCM10007148_27750 [Parvularcula lutaonensis]
MRLEGMPYDFPSQAFAMMHAERIMATAEEFLPGVSSVPVEQVLIGWRPLPIDGHPVLGAPEGMPEAYLAVMHSGVSLAPIAGSLAAREILTGEEVPTLGPYRPDRRFETVRRY